MKSDVLVIGAGVSGLTTAVQLAEQGLVVRLRTSEPPARTTSAVAGASWGPYLADDPRIVRWSETSRHVLETIAKDDESSGVRLVQGQEAARFPMRAPSWAVCVRDFRVCRKEELPDGYESGWSYTIPLLDMPRYLEYLTRRLENAGTTIEIGPVASLQEAAEGAPIVVNCSGLGARRLVPDDLLFPTRGHTLVVENPGIDTFFQDHVEDGDMTYILPHGDHCVLGGNAEPESEVLDEDEEVEKAILARCAAVEPRLRGAKVIEHRVGLRPTRAHVRVERTMIGSTVLIHNYGHGGSGVTLSWGCAAEVHALVQS